MLYYVILYYVILCYKSPEQRLELKVAPYERCTNTIAKTKHWHDILMSHASNRIYSRRMSDEMSDNIILSNKMVRNKFDAANTTLTPQKSCFGKKRNSTPYSVVQSSCSRPFSTFSEYFRTDGLTTITHAP